jgi:hypothetical protein
MALNRKKALERLAGLSPRVEEHLAKIAADPQNASVRHWTHEVNGWLRQMEGMVPYVGKKTASDWVVRIEAWRQELRG